VSWQEALSGIRDRLARDKSLGGVRFLVSAHAANEELFLVRRLVEEVVGRPPADAITVSWRASDKKQPAQTRFKVPAIDAPNVSGARLLGLAPGKVGDEGGQPNLDALRSAVESGGVAALYVFDPGPQDSVGDTSWIAAARKSGKLPFLVVQGVM